jgi:deoxycytidine triphosphate deaminase
MNHGLLPVALYPLMRVATLILATLSTEAERPYEGKYGEIEAYEEVESKLHCDTDLPILKRMSA